VQKNYTSKDTIETINLLIKKLGKYRVGELVMLDTAIQMELKGRGY